MCISPTNLPDGQLAACRKCWQCKARKIDDWVGRCIAETKTSDACHSVTLTYGRDDQGNEDHIKAAILTYSDVQKYFKRLRVSGYKFRYFCVGEYGSQKARAHWHMIIFWYGQHPEIEALNKRINEKHWKEGYSYFEEVSHQSIRYVCKYVLKDQEDESANGHLAMSKKPPLGHSYFQDLAQQYVDNALSPRTLEYMFPEVRREGKVKRFMMTGKTADNFLMAFIDKWGRQRGGHWPHSDLVQEFEDKITDLDEYHFGKLLKGIKYGETQAEKFAEYKTRVYRAGFTDIEAWYSLDPKVLAKRTDGTFIPKSEI